MKKYHWGILGTGTIAQEFVNDLRNIPTAFLHSVHSRTYTKAKAFANKYEFKTTHENISSFLKDPDLDVIYIATPNHMHCQQAIECMEADKHVLVEKPLALTADEAKKIGRSAEKTGRLCMEAMWMRFIPLYERVRKIIENKELGNIKFMSAELGFPLAYSTGQFRYLPEKGGGSLMDLGVYPLSLALMLLGKPNSVEGVCRKAKTGVDILNKITLYYENGPIVDIRSSFECMLLNGVNIVGDKGILEISGPIYRPNHFKLSHISTERNNQSPKIKSMLKKVPLFKKFVSGIRSRLSFLKNNNKTKIPYKGNGYRYEALEMMRLLDQKERESAIMPLNDSIAVLEITDKLRKQWEIVFPGIDKREKKYG